MSVKKQKNKTVYLQSKMPVSTANLGRVALITKLITLFVLNTSTDNNYLLVPCANQACVPSRNYRG